MSKKQKKQHDRPRVLVLGGGVSSQVEYAGGVQNYASYSDKRSVELVKNSDALVLTGGGDVDWRLYASKRNPATQTPNQLRDSVEMDALDAAYKRGIPVLGICRGAQLINVLFGGTLNQNITDGNKAHRYHLGHDHRVDLLKGTRLGRAMKLSEAWVTSIHHQAVEKVAPGFRVAARARDGVIEATESTSGPWVLGVQFHPEIDTHASDQRVFNSLVLAAARKAGLPTPKVGKKAPQRGPQPLAWSGNTGAFVPVRELEGATQVGGYTSAPSIGVPARRADKPRVDVRLTEWKCFRCGLEFDDRIDHVDHMFFLHGVDLLNTMSKADINDMLEREEA